MEQGLAPTQSSVLSPRSSLRLQPGTASAQTGRQTTVEVQAAPDASRPLSAWTIDVAYDAAVLKVVGCDGANGSLCNQDFGPGVIRITGASASGLVGEQALAQIRLQGIGHGKTRSFLHWKAAALAGPDGAPLAATGAGVTTP